MSLLSPHQAKQDSKTGWTHPLGTDHNRETRSIWFNVELAKKHPACLEYIVVHEMTHYFERNHGERFAGLMDEYLPDWRSRRDQLNESPLAEEVWT